jgi:hypothetical protein
MIWSAYSYAQAGPILISKQRPTTLDAVSKQGRQTGQISMTCMYLMHA